MLWDGETLARLDAEQEHLEDFVQWLERNHTERSLAGGNNTAPHGLLSGVSRVARCLLSVLSDLRTAARAVNRMAEPVAERIRFMAAVATVRDGCLYVAQDGVVWGARIKEDGSCGPWGNLGPVGAIGQSEDPGFGGETPGGDSGSNLL